MFSHGVSPNRTNFGVSYKKYVYTIGENIPWILIKFVMKCYIVVVEGESCKTDMFYINAIYKKIVKIGADCVGSVAGPRGEGVRTGSDRI